MARAMADTARGAVRQKFANVSLKIDAVKVSDQEAFGNGSGIM
jgi:hypothetical protein